MPSEEGNGTVNVANNMRITNQQKKKKNAVVIKLILEHGVLLFPSARVSMKQFFLILNGSCSTPAFNSQGYIVIQSLPSQRPRHGYIINN